LLILYKSKLILCSSQLSIIEISFFLSSKSHSIFSFKYNSLRLLHLSINSSFIILLLSLLSLFKEYNLKDFIFEKTLLSIFSVLLLSKEDKIPLI
jgi:hypothetical protein